jgi:hypothetical protein
MILHDMILLDKMLFWQIVFLGKYMMQPVFQFHRRLNPKLWRDDLLRPVVRLKLFQTAVAFYKFLDVDRLVVSDIIATGSNAAFNYTRRSDIDVHLIVDVAHSTCPKLADNLFLTKKALWGQTYNTSISGFPVELYVEDIGNPVKANGVFSILHNKWLKHPTPIRPTTDATDVRQKRDAYAALIDDLLSGTPELKEINALLARLRTLRQNGLEQGGEWSTENLAFKALRDAGVIQKLHDKRIEITDKKLSVPYDLAL